MTSFDEFPNLRCLLDEHGVVGEDWVEVRHAGYSGARIYKQFVREGASHVVKLTSVDTDWIMRSTSDQECREAMLANAPFGGAQISSPALGSARDGDTFSILMRDVSAVLLPNDRLTNAQIDAFLLGMSRLHSRTPPSEAAVPWCSVRDRLTLFEPDGAKLAGFKLAADILRGWELFFDYAPAEISGLVRSLFDDIGPLVRALGGLPNRLLHGDLKLDNVGMYPDGSLVLIDWSMAMIAPAAVELGWFLAMNSRTLPMPLDDALAAYTSYSDLEGGLHEWLHSLTILCGLLLRGWRKALDAEAGSPDELSWWCERAARASKMLRDSDGFVATTAGNAATFGAR
jgi:hypothetical protein